MIQIVWPDNHTVKGETFEELYDNLARGYRTHWHFRYIMIKRAKKWSNTSISIIHTKEGFVRELARARMFRLYER